MTVHRIMGIETEYGILQQGNAYANPMLMSSQIVTAYQARLNTTLAAARWVARVGAPLPTTHCPRGAAGTTPGKRSSRRTRRRSRVACDIGIARNPKRRTRNRAVRTRCIGAWLIRP